MKHLLDRLTEGEIIIADGAMGTMLFERGLRQGDCPELMNIEQPEILTEIAAAYLDAGAELIQTNTFGASPLKLSMYSLEHRTEEIINAAVQAVRKAVGNRVYISGSCGPTGKILKPYGNTDPEVISASFQRQIRALLDAGIDVICVETMIDITEATLAIKAAKSLSQSTPVIATMTFESTPRGFYTVMGVTIEQAANELKNAGADIIGSNCGNGIENMVIIAQEFRQLTDLPLIIQSNAGLPDLKDGNVVYNETPQFMAEKALQLVDAGVSIIGGCCGTTPEHIRVIKESIRSRRL